MAIVGVKYIGQKLEEIKQEYVDFNQLSQEEVGRLFKIYLFESTSNKTSVHNLLKHSQRI